MSFLVRSLQSPFSGQLAEAALASIASGVKLTWCNLSHYWWTEQDAKLLRELLRGGNITDEKFRIAVSKGISVYGRELYEQCINQGVFPDDAAILSEHAIAFAIVTGEIPRKKAEALNFDHGESLAVFLRNADGLLERIVSQLCTVPMSVPFGSGDGCSCEGCPVE